MRKYRGKILSINIDNTISRGTQTIGNLDSSIFVAKRYYEEEDNYEEEQELTKRVRFNEEKSKKKLSLGKKVVYLNFCPQKITPFMRSNRVNFISLGDILPDGTKIKKSASFNLFRSDDDDPSEEHDSEDSEQDDDEMFHLLKKLSILYLVVEKNGSCPLAKMLVMLLPETYPQMQRQFKRRIHQPQKVPHYVTNSVGHLYKSNYFDWTWTISLVTRILANTGYGSSRIIDLSTNMKDWFSVNDRKFMIKNHNAMLQVPAMENEESSFVTIVENICAFFRVYLFSRKMGRNPTTIRRIIDRYKKTGKTENLPRLGRPPALDDNEKMHL
ncbi:12018_t:CDS:2 [Funneliformis caledonium]|uniref:12018_t:CDS:1 n=1 Tax=Funneliformis caledonium TaxID=1117310 RepID=A0A9N9BSE4_9GLOM|nr:12018_t:CDS:2 [Funneliformis caledonium]